MRYTEQEMNSDLLDQPPHSGEIDEIKKIFICSTPRSGSYMLCRYMINAGLGVPHEYFNPIIMREIAPRIGLEDSVSGLKWRYRSPADYLPLGKSRRKAEVDFLKKYIDAIVPRRCRGGVFAAKIHFDQYLKVLDNPVGYSFLRGGLFVHLVRDNLLGQAISTHFANLTGRWGIDGAVTTVPAVRPKFFDVAAIDRTLEDIAEQNRGWRVLLAKNGVSAISIAYERLCEKDPFEFVVLLAKRLGIETGLLCKGYSEAGSAYREGDLDIPRKNEVARRYVEAVRKFRGPPKIKSASLPPIFDVTANNHVLFADLPDD